jgi:glycosyltransferase involved in cell wall biosynthesis
MKLAVLEKGPGFLSKGFSGPLRVVHSLCHEWKKMKDVELIVLSNTLINLLQFRFESQFPFIRRSLLKYRASLCQFDVLNVHGVSRNNLEVMKLSKKRRIPIVYTAHGVARKERIFGYPYSDDFINQEKSIVSLSDKIVAVSPSLKNLLIDIYKLPDEKVKVIYNGVDSNLGQRKYRQIDIRKKYGIPNSRKILINVGGTLKVKGIPFLIEALELLKRDDWHLVLIGPKGREHKDIIKSCNSKLGDHYTFTGVLRDDELLSFYHSAALFIATSEHEGFMLSALEALSCGTDIALRSTIPEAQHYFCDVPTLVERNVFDTPQELSIIITNYLLGKQRIEKDFLRKIVQFHSWENRAREYLQVFRQLTE